MTAPFIPASGRFVGLDLTLFYAPPLGDEVPLSLGEVAATTEQYITQEGADHAAVSGVFAVTHWIQSTAPAGIYQFVAGSPVAYNLLQFLQAASYSPLAFGTAVAANRNRAISPSGLNAGAISRGLQVQWAVRNLGAVGGSFAGFGTPYLELKNRYMGVSGSSFAEVGEQVIGYYIRTRSVNGFDTGGIGPATNIEYRNKLVGPNAINAIGLPFELMVSYKIRDALIGGEDAATFGEPTTTNQNQYRDMAGSSFAEIGTHRASRPPIVNNAGAFDSAIFGNQFVSHFIRYVEPQSLGDMAAVCQYTIGQFAQRMTVRLSGSATIHMLSEADSGQFGYPGIVNSQHVIRQLNCCSGVGKPGRPTVSAA